MMFDQHPSGPEENNAYPHGDPTTPTINLSEVRSHFEMLDILAGPLRNEGKLVICGFGEDTYKNALDARNRVRKLPAEIRHVLANNVDEAVDHVSYLGRREHY